MAADLTDWQCDGIGNAGCARANLVGDPNGYADHVAAPLQLAPRQRWHDGALGARLRLVLLVLPCSGMPTADLRWAPHAPNRAW